MNYVMARCLLCGKTYEVSEDHKDYKKLVEQNQNISFICDFCSNRVRHESDEVRKEKKPM
ncbi:MAG: DUF2197 domain-containing protein [Syntrophomonadaceae bacterium]